MGKQNTGVPRDSRLYGRLFFVLLFASIGGIVLGRSASSILTWLTTAFGGTDVKRTQFESFPSIFPLALLGALVGALAGNFLLTRFLKIAGQWDRMHTGDKVTLFLGCFAGLIGAIPVVMLMNAMQVQDPLMLVLGFLGSVVGFSGMSIYVLQSMSAVLPWNRGRGPGKRSGIKILDTNVIIDGRIYDVVRAGFLEGQLYVPGFVLDELQHIADSHDALRRQRGRRGLDVLRHMQADFKLEVRTHDNVAPAMSDDVDARLVRLARMLGADIVTNDFNLNRVAGLQEVRVLSLNDLALALRSTVMPQETLTLSVIREGNQPGQGVGYLEDGTMVVVENGKSHIGETLDVVVTQVIQTERGKMIFSEVEPDIDHDATARKGLRRGRVH